PDTARVSTGLRRVDHRGGAGPGIDPRDVVAGERGVPDLARWGDGDAVGARALGRLPDLDLAGGRVEAAVDAALPGEPQQAGLVEYRRIEIGAGGVRRQPEQAHLLARGIDPGDGVLPTFGHPGGPIRAEDDAVRRGTRTEGDLLELAAAGIEATKEALVLAGEPDGAIRRWRHVMRISIRGQLVVLGLSGFGGGGKDDEGC